ncbi:MAG TPA: BACON domain-containing carbohydrate-binding protein, partial [Verrucomicrobiae bacterium]
MSATQLNATASVPGTFIYSPTTNVVLAAGAGQILSVTFTPNDTANYNNAVRTVPINVTIGGKTVPTISWADPAPILSGSPLGNLQLNATASVAGSFAYAPPAGAVLPVGNDQTLSVVFTPQDGAHFAPVTKSVLIDVGSVSSNALVRVAYVVPANRTPQGHAVASLQQALLFHQKWFADQMEISGFGRKTFAFEPEPDGLTPFIHVVQIPQDDNELRSDLDGRSIINAVQAAGLPVGAPGQVWWLIPEKHREQADGAINGGFELGHREPATPIDGGWALSAGNHLALYPATFHTNILLYEGITVPDIGPFPLVQDVSYPWFEGTTLSGISSSALGAGLHSLSEAFGLNIDFRNDENFNGNVMGFGFRGIRGAMYPKLYPFNFCGLSYASALALDVNPFFNSGRLTTDFNNPSVTILTSGQRSPVSGLLQINFRATDDRALHAALLTWETDSGFVVAEERALAGTNVNATFSIPYFNAEQDNRYTITAFDRQGNRGVATTLIYPRASVNRSPQPFVTTLPTVAGLGQDIIFDASGTFDPEHSANLLEVEWDFDGDGVYDTEPNTELIITNNYYTLGSRIVRARITDPAGAVAVSAPVAVNVTTCLTTLSPLTRFHGFSGSTGAVEVTVGPKCNWLVVNTNDWIVILSGSNGISSGWVNYNVLPNPFFAERQGYLTIGDEVFLVRQHPVDCNFSLSPVSRFHGFGVGNNSFKVTTKTDCAWFVINTNSWIAITAGSNGVSTGNVFYALAENRVTGRRSGNIQVADKIFTVTQWGTNCEFVLSATSRAHSEISETGTVTVSTGSGLGGVSCAWSIENTNNWISIPASAGTNSGTLNYVVAGNPSLVPRTGVIRIAGQSFIVSQEACSYSIAPSSRTHTYLADTGTVAVVAENICSWAVSNTNNWVSIIEYASGGTGNATVKYTITKNPTSESRSAPFAVAGYPFIVTQSGKPCLYTLEPEESSYVEAGGVGEVQVKAEPGCFWSVINPAPWITITSGATGSSTGRVTFLVAANDGPARHSTLTIGEQDYSVSQASALRSVVMDPLTVASGQTSCTAVRIAANGGESNLNFSVCFNTNLLVFTSAQLQSNSIAGATLVISNAQAAQGRVGFSMRMPAGRTMSPGAEPQIRICFRGQNATGYPTTPLSFCDSPIARGLVNSFGQSKPASFTDGMATILGLCSLAESLDNTQLVFTIASGTWGCQTNVTYDGVDAAANGPVADGSDARLETTVNGPGTLSFWWKVSSEQDKDRLRFYLDDSEQLRISGEVDWEWRVFNLSAGPHDLRWRYSKGSSLSAGEDRGWVDQVLFEPLPPTITSHPASQAVDEGSTATFAIATSGQGPFNYQWLFNGLALADSSDIRGTRAFTLILSNVQPAQAGIYSVIVGNISGNLVSQPATLSVTPAVPLSVALDATNLTWLTSGNAPWIGQPVIALDGVDAGRSGV